tara:strand:+ start:278 stop:979 length:702 start_codon:yes stop_codon:yes gene_type:complete
MPVVSKKQGKFMQAVANSPKFANKVGVNQSVGKEFTQEKDMKKVKKMMVGGRAQADRAGATAMDPRMRMAMEAQRKRAAMGGMKKGGKVKKMRKGGNTSKMNDLEELGRVDDEKAYSAKGKRNLKDEKARVVREIKNKKAGGKVGYKAGGMMADKEGRAMAKNKKGMSTAKMADARGRAMKTGGMLARTGGSSAKMKAKGKAMKKGGAVKGRGNASKRADGIAKQGRTRGRIV